ncbi:MAG: HEAT repeat domain-containing protein [Bacteroidota bacterium]
MKKIFIIFILILSSLPGYAQDRRTTETKVADLLAMMPVNNIAELNKEMQEMSKLGPEGRQMITDMIVPPGSGDDTKARFAIESYSRYLSEYGHDNERYQWESECIDAVLASGYPMVRSFFLSQLKYIGGKRSVEFASGFLTDEEMCEPAVAVIAACNDPVSEDLLAMSLQIKTLPCAESVMNTLAAMKSDKAVNEYLYWYMSGDKSTGAAALNAMAESAYENVYPVLASAAEDASYGWDPTGATASLVQYARNLGDKGDMRNMEKICRDVFSNATVEYKIAALEALVYCKGYEAIEYLLTGFRDGEHEYRKAILDLAGEIPGKAATRKWINMLPAVDYTQKAEIIEMLGERGDLLAVSPIKDALFSSSPVLRVKAAMALAKLQGRESVQELTDYIRSYQTADDQIAGYHALRTVLDSRRRDVIADALEGSGNHTKETLLILLAEGGEKRFFNTLFKYTSSSDPKLRSIAFSELKSLAGKENLEQLIDLLLKTTDKGEIEHVQKSIVAAAGDITEEEERTSMIIKAMEDTEQKEKFFSVLAELGGEKALATVSQVFEKGDAEMRALTFNALADWNGYEASSALYDICASGNKNYSDRAFFAYIDKVYKANITAESKLKLLKKIKPYALTDNQKKLLEEKIDSVKESIPVKTEEEAPEATDKYILSEKEVF